MDYAYAIVKVMKSLDGRPTSTLVDVVGIAMTKVDALRVADEKSAKSYNYVYLIKKVHKY